MAPSLSFECPYLAGSGNAIRTDSRGELDHQPGQLLPWPTHSRRKLLMKRNAKTARKLVLLASMLLAACGGGSGIPSGPIVLTGVFTDSAVGGLSYATATQSGVTNAAGEFTYLAGEIITFSIGGTVIGEPVTATVAMTPLDLVPGAPLISTLLETRNASRDPDSAESRALNRFVNIIVFLQSLDEDANPDNGITIPAVCRAATVRRVGER